LTPDIGSCDRAKREDVASNTNNEMKAFTDNVFAGLKIFCVSSGLLEFFEF
jgi:hypothetical protein